MARPQGRRRWGYRTLIGCVLYGSMAAPVRVYFRFCGECPYTAGARRLKGPVAPLSGRGAIGDVGWGCVRVEGYGAAL